MNSGEPLFTCNMPKQPGAVRTWLLNLMFRRVKRSPHYKEYFLKIPEDALFAYIGWQKSTLEWLMAYMQLQQDDLPAPQTAPEHHLVLFHSLSALWKMVVQRAGYLLSHHKWPVFSVGDHVRRAFDDSESVLIVLANRKNAFRQMLKEKSDPLDSLIEYQHHTQKPIFIIPQMVFYSTKPSSTEPGVLDAIFGPPQKPGFFRRMTALFTGKKPVIFELSEPLNLQDFMAETAWAEKNGHDLAVELRRRLLRQMDAHRRSVTGPILKTHEETRQHILTSPRVQEYIRQSTQRRDITTAQAQSEAISMVDEIAGRYSPFLVSLLARIGRWLYTSRFDGLSIEPDGLGRIKRAGLNGPLIFIPCHKSNLDSMSLGYSLHLNHLPPPHFFAGKNLSFWPVGPLLRRTGAFFVRRSFRGAVFYTIIFSEYIRMLMKEGYNIAVYIEGTRSRTGKFLPPQVGMLSILMNAWKQGDCEDLSFVPVFIGYDRVPEEDAYFQETQGKEKAPESFRQLLKARRFFKTRYGRVYLRFGSPLSLKQQVTELGETRHKMNSKKQNQLSRFVAGHALSAIDEMTVIPPRALVACAVLTGSDHHVTYEQIKERFDAYISYLLFRKVEIAETVMIDSEAAIRSVLSIFTQRKFLRVEQFVSEESPISTRFRIIPSQRPAMDYYKNNCLSALYPAMVTAMAIVDLDRFQFTFSESMPCVQQLHELLSEEFPSYAERSSEELVRRTIKSFINEGMIVPHPTLPDTYNVSSRGFRILRLFADLLKSTLEAYWIVIRYLESEKDQDAPKKKKRIKKMVSFGKQILKNSEINRMESLSVPVLKNAEDCFSKRRMVGEKGKERRKDLERSIHRWIDRLE